MNRRRSCLMGLAWLLAGLLAGVGVGVIVGWVIWPVNYVDTDIVDLRLGYQDDYILMVSDVYLLNGDLAQAQQRLSYLAEPNMAGRVGALVRSKMSAGEPAEKVRSLVALAQALRVDTQEMLDYVATNTPTPTPRATATPDHTATPVPSATPDIVETDTPTPTVTRAPLPTHTIVPSPLVQNSETLRGNDFSAGPVTATETATAVATGQPSGEGAVKPLDFRVLSQRLMHKMEVGGCEAPAMIFVKAIDAGGKFVDGVVLRVYWDGGEFDPVVTGSKGPGTAEVVAWSGDYYIEITGNVGGEEWTGDRIGPLRTALPEVDDLLDAGYCESVDPAECERRRDNNELCAGHYSYEVIFQRQW